MSENEETPKSNGESGASDDPGSSTETRSAGATGDRGTPGGREPGGREPASGPEPGGPSVDDKERQTRQWSMLIHFSILAGWVVPLAGVVVPVLLWQLKKDELPGIRPHAHVVLNWILSSLVYAVICFILLFIAIGALGFFLLAVLTVVYAIIGGVKANEGEVWEYPGTIIRAFDV
mgnify:CR=1 FL=1